MTKFFDYTDYTTHKAQNRIERLIEKYSLTNVDCEVYLWSEKYECNFTFWINGFRSVWENYAYIIKYFVEVPSMWYFRATNYRYQSVQECIDALRAGGYI